MYIATIPNRNSPPAILLRAGYREGGKVKSRTLANLSKWPRQRIATLRLLLKGEKLAPLGKIFEIAASQRRIRERAAQAAIKRLGFERVISPAPSRERDVIMDMIVALILAPESDGGKNSLSDILGVTAADRAMDWLARRQGSIERELARRNLIKGGLALLGLSSSSLKGGLRADYGMLTDLRGRPVSIAVQMGGAGALMTRSQRMKEDFGLGTIVLVADRGVLSEEDLDELRAAGGLDWVVPLNARTLKKLVDERIILPELFDQRGLLEFSHPDFPGERFAARRDEKMSVLRARQRRASLAATSRALARLQVLAGRGTLAKMEIEAKARAIVDARKTGKFFVLNVEEGGFRFRVNEEEAAKEGALDGISVLRTSLAAERLSAKGVVDGYEILGRTKRIFRSTKAMDFEGRPNRRRLEEAVPRHFFLRMLACCVERHMRQA